MALFGKKENKEKVIDPEKLEKQKKVKKIMINIGKAAACVAGGALLVVGALIAIGSTTETEASESNTDENEVIPEPVTEETTEENPEESV